MSKSEKPDPIVIVWPDGTVHTGTRGSGLSEVTEGALVLAGCQVPGGALGKTKNERHIKMLQGPLALRVIDAISAARFRPGELVVTFHGEWMDVGAYAESRAF